MKTTFHQVQVLKKKKKRKKKQHTSVSTLQALYGTFKTSPSAFCCIEKPQLSGTCFSGKGCAFSERRRKHASIQ